MEDGTEIQALKALSLQPGLRIVIYRRENIAMQPIPTLSFKCQERESVAQSARFSVYPNTYCKRGLFLPIMGATDF